MSDKICAERIHHACEKVCQTLLEHKTPEGYWVGRLSDSALSTATAVSALTIYCYSPGILANLFPNGKVPDTDEIIQKQQEAKQRLETKKHELKPLKALIRQGVAWLVAHQNPDGGWGDTDKSLSNISTTLLVRSALALASNHLNDNIVATKTTCQKADEYLDHAGGIAAIRKRYGNDQTFSVPILTNAALAGLADWNDIPQLPFELAALPMTWFRFFKMNVVSYAIPALVAIGQVKFHFAPEKKKFISNFFRRLTKKRTLQLIQEMQPASGGYLEAAPLTSFVVMSLSAMGLTDHPIVTKGIRFLVESFREGGSVPIDTNLATWLTSMSMVALGDNNEQTTDWLLSCQHKQRHPFTGASPGGWGWTNLTGAVPDADDTSAALLALAAPQAERSAGEAANIESAAIDGINWLLGLQNSDGGIPTFCQGWGMLPFDKSSTDITAHAVRAFQAWRGKLEGYDELKQKMRRAEERMFAFLERTQQPDGSWHPLWFGNQFMSEDANPCYGTARVLLALAESKAALPNFEAERSAMAESGLRYLIRSQNTDGGWGRNSSNVSSSVEETAVVVEALSLYVVQRAEDGVPQNLPVATAYHRGLDWLLEAVESDHFMEASPIGLYFASLWYYEDLYPIIFTALALRRAAVGSCVANDE